MIADSHNLSSAGWSALHRIGGQQKMICDGFKVKQDDRIIFHVSNEWLAVALSQFCLLRSYSCLLKVLKSESLSVPFPFISYLLSHLLTCRLQPGSPTASRAQEWPSAASRTTSRGSLAGVIVHVNRKKLNRAKAVFLFLVYVVHLFILGLAS